VAALFDPDRIAAAVTGDIFPLLDEPTRAEVKAAPDLGAQVAGALAHPKPLGTSRVVLNAVLAAQYREVLEALAPPRALAVYEPCVGSSSPVIVATEAYSGGRGRYFTINLNRPLREELAAKVAHLRLEVKIVEDDAQRALAHLGPASFDVACFHHAVNDILQTAVSEPRGMDTSAVDWWASERQMIEWLAEDAAAGRLETRGRPELLRIVADATRLVRPGGFLAFDHFNWCRLIGVDWFPWDLFYDLIPTTRRWIREAGLPVEELRFPGADPRWWLFLRVTG
jgi:hypothetical protein